MPVGFVHVAESKEELFALNIPHIGLRGNRGGSPLTVSVIHALLGLAGAGPGSAGLEGSQAQENAVHQHPERRVT
jgi:hypothetical protein